MQETIDKMTFGTNENRFPEEVSSATDQDQIPEEADIPDSELLDLNSIGEMMKQGTTLGE